MSDQLFDPEPYGHAKPKPAKAIPPPSSVIGVSGERWNGTSRRTPGVFHFIVGKNKRGGLVSACKRVVVPLTIGAGETRPGCAECVEHGARANTA